MTTVEALKRIGLVAFALGGPPVAFMACPPTSPPISPTGDAAPLTDATIADCMIACNAMARVGCSVQTDCARVMCAANADPRFTHYDTLCLSKVLVPTDVAACGVPCQTPSPGALEGP